MARESFDAQRFDRKVIQAKVEEHVNGWRALLTNHVEDGRRLLREVLEGPLRFTPERKAYRFEGEAAIGRLFAGVAGVAPFLASPTGHAASGRFGPFQNPQNEIQMCLYRSAEHGHHKDDAVADHSHVRPHAGPVVERVPRVSHAAG